MTDPRINEIQARVDAFDWVTLRANLGDAERMLDSRGAVAASTIRGLVAVGRYLVRFRTDIPFLLARLAEAEQVIADAVLACAQDGSRAGMQVLQDRASLSASPEPEEGK